MTSREHFNTKILKYYSENGSLMIVFHGVLRTVEIALYKFGRWACGKLVVLDLSEPVQQIGEKLFAVLDDGQRQELIQYILVQKLRVCSNTSPYSVSAHAMSDSLNTKLTEIHTESLYFCLENRIVSVCDTEIKLTVKEFDIFALLIMNPDRVLTYNMIVDLVWNENLDYYSRRTINNHVSNLRRKLKVTPETPDYIRSVHGIGYKFNPKIKFL